MMNSLLRSVNSLSNRRHMLVRESLQQHLNTTVIEMQSAPGVLEACSVEICDEALALCSALEAIFLHGLKDSLLNRVTEALSGPDYDAMPQPSFWGPLLVFSHRQIIDQIQAMSQLTSEVGFCRAWIRLALNEGLLSSYLAAIRRDNSALKPYYNRAAFIRDTDLVEVAQRLIESIDYIQFDLASNSSLLNFWSSTPLLMAAIWSPPMKSCPIFSAVDIAKTINSERVVDNDDNFDMASSIGSLSSFNSSQNNLSGLSEDEAFKAIIAKKMCRPDSLPHVENFQKSTLILGSPPPHRVKEIAKEVASEKNELVGETQSVKESAKEFLQAEMKANKSQKNNALEKRKTEVAEDVVFEENTAKADAAVVGNSLIGKLGWSSFYEDCEMPQCMTSSMVSRTSAGENPQTPSEGPSYDALLKSYHTGEYKSPNLEELLEKYPAYVPVVSTVINTAEPRETRSFDEQLGRLAREKGLDLQNYNCLECGQLIGLNFSKANVCCFSGHYFCSNCMATEEYLIPSRVIHNWDLKHYPVCLKAAKYLAECTTLLDLKVLNPRIYLAVDIMAQLQSLRVQLNLLRAYLFTCREPIIEMLQKKVAPKDYLYEHIHQYSVLDLADIPNGTLAQHLQKVVEFARNHVMNCWLCSQKGFICEICNHLKVIYPFDVQSTFRCGTCNAVFHADCQNANKPCPKCERRRKRMDLPLLDMDNSDLVNETTMLPTIAIS